MTAPTALTIDLRAPVDLAEVPTDPDELCAIMNSLDSTDKTQHRFQYNLLHAVECKLDVSQETRRTLAACWQKQLGLTEDNLAPFRHRSRPLSTAIWTAYSALQQTQAENPVCTSEKNRSYYADLLAAQALLDTSVRQFNAACWQCDDLDAVVCELEEKLQRVIDMKDAERANHPDPHQDLNNAFATLRAATRTISDVIAHEPRGDVLINEIHQCLEEISEELPKAQHAVATNNLTEH